MGGLFDLGHGETVGHRVFLGSVQDPDTGSRKDTWAEPVPIEGVGVDAPTVQEPQEGATRRSSVEHVLFLPPGFTCGHRDHFIIRGKRFEIEGRAEPLPNFFSGALFRTEISVKRWDG